MIHQTATLTLIDSQRWALLLQQIRRAKKLGQAPSDIYHMLDRFPGAVRKELHDAFRKEGWDIEHPLFKRHINPLDMFFSDEALTAEGDQYAFVNRDLGGDAADNITLSPSAVSAQFGEDEDEKQEKKAFSKQFKQASGIDLFAQAFMANTTAPLPDVNKELPLEISEVEHEEDDTAQKKTHFLSDPDYLATHDNPSGVTFMTPTHDPRHQLQQIRASLGAK